jgi:hypothetical protein
MSNWIVIAEVDLYDAKAAALVEAADSVQLGPGQESRSAQVIADVTAEIRRKVARCNQLDQNVAAIPGGLKNCALDIIIARLKIALEQELTSDEKEGLKARERELNRIADGKDLVDPPDNPMPANMTQAIAQPSMGHWRHRDFTLGQQDG